MATLIEGFYQNLLEANGIAVVIADARAAILSVNKAVVAITGYGEGELIGKNPRIFQSGLTPKSVYAEMWQALKSGKTWTGQVVNRRKNGELYTAYETIVPIVNPSGAAFGFIATQREMTVELSLREEVKRLQDALIRAAENPPVAGPTCESPVQGLFAALLARHEALAAHAARVWLISDRIAQATGAYDQLSRTQLCVGALLHDIGKLGLSDRILISSEKHSEEGQVARRRHTITGFEIAQAITSDPVVLSIIRSHHERLDGSGYPDHLMRAEVPLGARIVMVADLFDTMVNPLGSHEPTEPEIVLSSLLGEALAGRFDMVSTRYLADLYREGVLDAILRMTEHEAIATVLQGPELARAA